jgi:hypothetical protein
VACSETVAATAMDTAEGVTERAVRDPGPPEPCWFLTPLQAVSSKQNERIQILCRKYFLRGIESRLDQGKFVWGRHDPEVLRS